MRSTVFVAMSVFYLLIAVSSWGETPERLNLSPDPSFEQTTSIDAWFPIGVANSVGEALEIDGSVAHSGKHSLKVNVANEVIISGSEFYSSYNAGEGVRRMNGLGASGVRTIAFRLDRDIDVFDASAWVYANDDAKIELQVRWFDRFGRRRPLEIIHTDAASNIIETNGKWKKFNITAKRPNGAHQAQFVVVTNDVMPFFIDDVSIDLLRREGSMILVNQIGYEPDSQAKIVLFQNNIETQTAPRDFKIINLETQESAFKGEWISLGYHQTFDRFYYRADFNDLAEIGTYVIETRIGEMRFYSDPFQIRDGVLFDQAAQPAYNFFYYQRCGMAVPGLHAACHLDDAKLPDGSHRDLSGGWHDAGDYNKYNGYTPESFHALITAYNSNPEYYQQFDRDNDGVCDLLDEAIWGADFMLKCLDRDKWRIIGAISTGYRFWGKPEDETDNLPGTGDERPVTDWNGNTSFLVSSFALLSKHAPKPNQYLETAKGLYEAKGGTLLAEIALYQATGDSNYQSSYIKRAQEYCKTDAASFAQFRSLALFNQLHPDHELSGRIKEIAALKIKEMQKRCDSVFGVHQRNASNGEHVFFRDYAKINDWYVGESRELLDFCYDGLLLESLGLQEGRTIAEQQLNWMFGMNPFGVSLMHGVGDRFLPQHHHRYNTLPAIPNGAVQGAVLNGIVRAWPWTDRPWIDMNLIPTGEYQCNEPWLPHNNRMLYVMSLLN